MRSLSRTITASSRASRSGRSPASSVARRRRSRRTSTTHLMLQRAQLGTGGRGRRSRASGVTCPPRHQERKSFPDGPFLRWARCPARSVGLGLLMLDRVTERRRAAQLPATTATRRVCRSRRSLVGWDAQKPPSRRISTTQPAIRHARSRHATGDCVAAAGRPPRHGTARAMPSVLQTLPSWRDAPKWTRERVREAMRAWQARYGAAPSSYDWSAPTHAGAAAKRSNDYGPENGRRRPLSRSVRSLGGGPRRRLRRRMNARATMPLLHGTSLCAWSSVNAGANGAAQAMPFVSVAAARPPARRDCWARERQRRALASRRGSGRRQAPRRRSQPRQSRPTV